MSQTGEEAPITARVGERPAFSVDKVRRVKLRDLAVRFLAGAVTSAVAGGVTLVFGARAGGLFLAFPAILAASLTLIEEQQDSAEAREDARGAVLGGCALGLFAAVGALTFTHMNGALVLLLASATWLTAAGVGYLVAWLR